MRIIDVYSDTMAHHLSAQEKYYEHMMQDVEIMLESKIDEMRKQCSKILVNLQDHMDNDKEDKNRLVFMPNDDELPRNLLCDIRDRAHPSLKMMTLISLPRKIDPCKFGMWKTDDIDYVFLLDNGNILNIVVENDHEGEIIRLYDPDLNILKEFQNKHIRSLSSTEKFYSNGIKLMSKDCFGYLRLWDLETGNSRLVFDEQMVGHFVTYRSLDSVLWVSSTSHFQFDWDTEEYVHNYRRFPFATFGSMSLIPVLSDTLVTITTVAHSIEEMFHKLDEKLPKDKKIKKAPNYCFFDGVLYCTYRHSHSATIIGYLDGEIVYSNTIQFTPDDITDRSTYFVVCNHNEVYLLGMRFRDDVGSILILKNIGINKKSPLSSSTNSIDLWTQAEDPRASQNVPIDYAIRSYG